MRQTKTIIAAVARNGVIGLNNKLPWTLAGDWQHFKCVTQGHSFLMGRKSYQAEDHLLSDRWNYILTRQTEIPLLEKSSIVHSFDAFFKATEAEAEVFILGGAEVFRKALLEDRVNKMILTWVEAEPKGDAFFPAVDWPEWDLIKSEAFQKNAQNDHDYLINTYVRKTE